MTTIEKWKAGILITGMLVVAFIENSLGVSRFIVQPQPIPAYAPVAPVVAAPVEPQYPIHKTITVTQDGWSEGIAINDGKQLEWSLHDDNAWLDTRANRTEEFRQFPANDSRWKPLRTPAGTRMVEFRITPGTPVQTATLEVTLRKSEGDGFFAQERTLPSVTPSLTDAGVKAGHQWPSELTPTRITCVGPENLVPGKVANDKIYPIEDVLYVIKSGWILTPFTYNPDDAFEATPTRQGVRVRLLNPSKTVNMQFKITKDVSENTVISSQLTVPQQTAPNWNYSQTPRPNSQPAVRPYPYVRPYVAPQQPSYYRTSPGGPSYYPSQRNP